MAYKTLHSEGFYRSNWERLYRKHSRRCDFENRLSREMEAYAHLPEDIKEMLEGIESMKVAGIATQEMKKEMEEIKEINEGRASLGYTSMRQEVEARHDLVEGFEFACLVLADFKKKYGIA